MIYPAVNRQAPNPSDPERGFYGALSLPNDVTPREEVCDILFAGFGNHPGNEMDMGRPGYRFTTGNPSIDSAHLRWQMARARSMSVGDVVNFENSNLYYICDSSGWYIVNKELATSWLKFPRQYGCCSFELRQWKQANGLKD